MNKMLSEREKKIMSDVTKGYEDKEIAVRQHISPRTVSTHLSRIYEKISARNRAHAVAIFMKTFLFPELSDVF